MIFVLFFLPSECRPCTIKRLLYGAVSVLCFLVSVWIFMIDRHAASHQHILLPVAGFCFVMFEGSFDVAE